MALFKRFFHFFALVALLLLSGCKASVPLVNNISEKQANEIIVFLASRGITAQKELAPSGGAGGGSTEIMWNIVVESEDAPESMALLSRNGLPRTMSPSLLDLFGNTGLVPTDTQQKILYQAGLADQIGNMIKQIDGVIDVAVQISLPTDETAHPTASVYVKHQGVLDNPNTQLVLKIRQLVAASIVGLSMDNVTVVADRSRFTDISLSQSPTSVPEQVRDYVSIWGVTIAKESVLSFQALFFALFFLLFILLIAVGWLFYKTRPLMEQAGGLALLLKKDPFPLPGKGEPVKKEETEAATPPVAPPASPPVPPISKPSQGEKPGPTDRPPPPAAGPKK